MYKKSILLRLVCPTLIQPDCIYPKNISPSLSIRLTSKFLLLRYVIISPVPPFGIKTTSLTAIDLEKYVRKLIKNMKIISLAIKKIWRYLVFAIIPLVVLVAVFSRGVSIENFDFGGIKIERLYIKLDKKLILRAQNIEIPKQSKKDSSNDYLLSLTENIAWLDRLFSEILLERIKFENSEITLLFNKNSFHLDSPFLNLDAVVSSSANGIIADINNLEFKDFNISMQGIADADIKRNLYDFKGKFQCYELEGAAKFKLENNLLRFELSDVNASSLERFTDALEIKTQLNEEVKKWIYGYITADDYYVKIFSGKINIEKDDFFLNELYADGVSKNLKVKFHENLAPADIKQANIILKNGELLFELIEPAWQGKNLDGSNLKIYNIFSNGAGLSLNLKINSLYDKNVNSILKAYDINVPVEQLSGKTQGVLGLDIKFDPLAVTPKGEFIIKGGKTLIAQAPFHIGEAEISLRGDKLRAKTTNSGMDFFKGDVVANLDLNKQKGDVNGTAKDFNLSFNDKEILSFKDLALNTELDFSGKTTKMRIFNPDVRLSFGNENEIKIKDVSRLVADSALLTDLGVRGADFTLKTKNFDDFTIEAKGVEFNAPLLNKDSSPYDKDDFFIEIKNGRVSGKSASEKLTFSAANGKIDLDIKDVDLTLNSDGVSDEAEFEIDARNSGLIISDLNSSLSLLNYHASIRKDALRFDAKPPQGSFGLIKSKTKFEMFASDISGEFVNSVFNIKSFSGGKFKMRILGENTKDFKGEVRLIGATLKDFTFYHQLLTFINSVPSLLTFKAPDFDASGYPVKFGKILFERKGDVLEIIAAELEGSSADIAGRGNINLKTKKIDVDLEIKLLKDASSIIDKIPLINQIVLGKDRSISTVVKVRGTLEKPEYSTQILADTLLSPVKIIRNILQAPFLIFE